MLDSLVDIVATPKTLTITNCVLAVCIIVHLICEFGHYIHEYLSRKKDTKKLTANNELLHDMKVRIEKIEKTQEERGRHNCPLKPKKEEEPYVDNKVYVETV